MIAREVVSGAAQAVGMGPLSFILRRLERRDEQALEIDPARRLYPASMIKAPLALAAFALVQDGVVQPSGEYVVTKANMTPNDKPSPLVPGYRATLDQLIDLMLTRSDNVATNMLFDILDRERATQIVQQRYDLTQTAFYRKLSGSLPLIADPLWDQVHRNSHPAADCAHLFTLIARDEVPYAYVLRSILARQQWNEKLPAGLRPGDHFAHKTGDTDEVTHDGGILDTDGGASYVIVVYTGMESNDTNNAKFAPFMSAIRPYL